MEFELVNKVKAIHGINYELSLWIWKVLPPPQRQTNQSSFLFENEKREIDLICSLLWGPFAYWEESNYGMEWNNWLMNNEAKVAQQSTPSTNKEIKFLWFVWWVVCGAAAATTKQAAPAINQQIKILLIWLDWFALLVLLVCAAPAAAFSLFNQLSISSHQTQFKLKKFNLIDLIGEWN